MESDRHADAEPSVARAAPPVRGHETRRPRRVSRSGRAVLGRIGRVAHAAGGTPLADGG
jgi:hypothetical protein